MPGPVSDSYPGPPDDGPYIPSWCYPNNSPKICPCGHHEGYHAAPGLRCVRFRKCGCEGLPYSAFTSAQSPDKHAYLGAKPGPGIDLSVEQLGDRAWKAEGLTPCGRAFLLKLYGGDRYGADNQMAFAEFRRRVVEWGLTMDITWPKAKVEEL